MSGAAHLLTAQAAALLTRDSMCGLWRHWRAMGHKNWVDDVVGPGSFRSVPLQGGQMCCRHKQQGVQWGAGSGAVRWPTLSPFLGLDSRFGRPNTLRRQNWRARQFTAQNGAKDAKSRLRLLLCRADSPRHRNGTEIPSSRKNTKPGSLSCSPGDAVDAALKRSETWK
jgi:hypothetical protein